MKIARRLKGKFISIPMEDGVFTVEVYLVHNGILSNFDAKIDTGCTHSLIPYDRLYGIVDREAFRKAKEASLRKNKWSLGCGVETDRDSLKSLKLKLKTEKDRLDCTYIRLLEKFENIRIGDVSIPSKYMNITYDLTCSALIGMEILKDWDIHISKSIKTEETILLACPLNRINQDYIDALIDEFDIGQRMISQLMAKISNQTIEANYINDKLNIHKKIRNIQTYKNKEEL